LVLLFLWALEVVVMVELRPGSQARWVVGLMVFFFLLSLLARWMLSAW
jgi:hypothetical protein